MVGNSNQYCQLHSSNFGAYCTVQYSPISYGKFMYSGRKITEILGNVKVRGEKDGKSKMGTRLSTVCLSKYNITENIYYSQLSTVAILLQPEPNCFTSYNTRKWLFFSLFAIIFRSPPATHVSNSNSQWSSQLFCVYYNLITANWCIHYSLWHFYMSRNMWLGITGHGVMENGKRVGKV
jgi:hypothetical protein